MIIAYPARTGMRDLPHQGFDLTESNGEITVGLTQHIPDPSGGPADKVGPKQGKLLLDLHPNGRADQMTLQSEHVFLFFDTRFDDLTAIVLCEPL
jgi:hypothetical protein